MGLKIVNFVKAMKFIITHFKSAELFQNAKKNNKKGLTAAAVSP